MDNPKLSLWFAYPTDLLTDSQGAACVSLLDEEERARMGQFRAESLRREFLATRVLLRMALSHRRTQPPETWRFRHNPWGKPAVDSDCGLRFNVTNCPRLVACLTAEKIEVGVDAEPYERAATIAELTERVFSPLEQAQIGSLDVECRQDRALSLWVLKEAWIKAYGMGMSLPLQDISFHFDASGDIRLEPIAQLAESSRRSWRYCLLDHCGHRIAVVAETTAACTLEVSEVRPLLNPPLPIDLGVPEWYPSDRSALR